MILRLSTPRARGLFLLVAIAVTSVFAVSGVRNALAVHYADRNSLVGFERATRLEPADARNWYLLGRFRQYNLEDPDSKKAILAYQKSLSLDSNSADAWCDLATAYEAENNFAAAMDAFRRAQGAYPSSPDVAWRYGNFLLRRGDVDAAFAEIKRAVQVDPKRGAAAFSLGMRVNPDVPEVLARALPASPFAYLSVLAALAETQQTDQGMIVWDRLVRLHPHLVPGDASGFLEALLHKLEADRARRVWNETLTLSGFARPADAPGSLVWDGGFESAVVNTGLAWRYPRDAGGVQIARDAEEKHTGEQSLRLTFNGLSNVEFHDVCQYVPVEAATLYHFAAWVETRALSSDQGVRFGLYSLGAPASSVAWTADVRGTQPWTRIELDWTSAALTRELFLCASRLRSREFDSKIHGLAWIDDVSLTPVSAPSPRL